MLKTKTENKIPESWEIRRLGEICFTTSGGTPSRKISSYYEGTIPWVKSGELEKGTIKETEEYISQDALKNSSAKIFPKGTLLIALYGATIGKLGFLGVDAATNQAVCGIFQNDIVDLSFLKHFLFFSKRKLVEQSAGGAQPNISQAILKDLSIVIPPANEQKRIVAKIEELFSRLDAGVDSLKKAQAQLKTYRQAVLKWAFEGKFTNKKKDDNELPDGWYLEKLETVAENLDSRRRPINKSERAKREGNIPYYGANGRTGWIDDYLFNEPLVLVVEDETFVGRELPFSYKISGKSWVNNHAHVLKPSSKLNIDFLNYQLSYYPFLQLTTGTTGRKKLTKNALMNATIRVCSLPLQQHVVSEIEKRLSVCDKLEESIAQGLKQAEALKQSILKKAFEGKLVPQNPDDEPAGVLLERICSDRKKNATIASKKERL